MNFFFFNDTATTEIYTLSLHDALPICARLREPLGVPTRRAARLRGRGGRDRGPGAQRRGGRAAGDSRRAPLRLRAPAGGPAAAARRRAPGLPRGGGAHGAGARPPRSRGAEARD